MILDRTAQMVYVLGKMQRDGLTPSPPEFTTYGLTDPGGGGGFESFCRAGGRTSWRFDMPQTDHLLQGKGPHAHQFCS